MQTISANDIFIAETVMLWAWLTDFSRQQSITSPASMLAYPYITFLVNPRPRNI